MENSCIDEETAEMCRGLSPSLRPFRISFNPQKGHIIYWLKTRNGLAGLHKHNAGKQALLQAGFRSSIAVFVSQALVSISLAREAKQNSCRGQPPAGRRRGQPLLSGTFFG